jgi:hypothetical protein
MENSILNSCNMATVLWDKSGLGMCVPGRAHSGHNLEVSWVNINITSQSLADTVQDKYRG